MAAPEGLGHQVGDVGVGHVIEPHVPHALVRQAGRQDFGGVLRVAVDGAAEDGNGFILGGVAAPPLVLLHEPADVLPPDGTMEGAEVLDAQPRRFFQQGLHLGAVLAHDIGIVPPGIGEPLGLEIHLVVKNVPVQRAEGAEGVGREEDFVRCVIGHHDLRPVDHGSQDEGELVPPGGDRVSLFHYHAAVGDVGVEKLADHGDGLGAGRHLGLGMGAEHRAQGGTVVRLHMVHHHIVQGTALEGVLQVLVKVGAHGAVRRVQQDGLLVHH